MSQYAHNRKGHASKITKCVTNENFGRVPVKEHALGVTMKTMQ